MYAIIGFDFSGSFEQETYNFDYNGYEMELTKDSFEVREGYPVPRFNSNQLRVRIAGGKGEREHEQGLMFLSELSWLYKVQVFATEHITAYGGSCTALMAGHRFKPTPVNMDYYKPMPLNDEQRLAVGLFREGFSSTSIFYRLLGLYKILEILMDNAARVVWMTKFLKQNWHGFGFEKAFEYVPKDPAELQKELWHYGRCGVAHGGADAVKVHSLYDRKKISLCCSVISDAVEHYMKKEMGIPDLLYY